MRRAGGGLPESELSGAAAYAPHLPVTPLRESMSLAAMLGLSSVFIKDETARWGLNAFKITGASYAIACVAADARALVCASAGNHGRAVARAARDRGIPCRVFLPADALDSRVGDIRAEGADAVRIDGSYEDALGCATRDAAVTGATLISDTSPPGDPRVPALILRGYTRIFSEASVQWSTPPDLIVLQGGVGGLVGAGAAWIRTRLPDATLIAAEPEGAACLLASARAGRRVALSATTPTTMVCLRCAEPSEAAWPFIAAGVDGFITVTDAQAALAAQALDREGISSGPSGACGLAALTALAPCFPSRRALVVVTEGH